MDELAQKDFSYHMTQAEYFRHRKNWWISLNNSGKTGPMRDRSDFNDALTKLHRLHRESGEERLAPIPYWQYQKLHPSSSSSSTSWWQWNDSWWSSWKLRTNRTASELMKVQHTERRDPLCRFFKNRSEGRLCKIFCLLQLDRLQLTAVCCNRRCVWTAHLTRHIFSLFQICLHAHAWLKSGVRTSFHESSSCAHVVCLILFEFSTFLSLLFTFSPIVLSPWPSTSSSAMWWTNFLCTLANEDLGTLAEYDPLTGYEPNDGENGSRNDRTEQFPGNRREVWTVTPSHSAQTDSYYYFVRIGCFGDHRLANRSGCVFPSLSEVSTSGLEETCPGVINRRGRDRFKLQVKIHRCSLTHLFNLMTTHLHTNSNSVIVSSLRSQEDKMAKRLVSRASLCKAKDNGRYRDEYSWNQRFRHQRKKLGATRCEHEETRQKYKTLIRCQEVRLGHSDCLRMPEVLSWAWGGLVRQKKGTSAVSMDSSLNF